MRRQPITTFTSTTVVLDAANVDTDQIIPARFLKVTDKRGLGRWLFADWRYDEHGAPRPDFVLNRAEAAGARVLVAGANFACGSSREHAPWALVDHGFQAVVSSSIADIFRNNAPKNGLVPVVVDPATHRALLATPGRTVTIDLDALTLSSGDGDDRLVASFPLDPFARYCLMNGVDELGFLLDLDAEIAAHERAVDGAGR